MCSTDEFQDQGLTRPKVLIVLPMKEAALRTVKLIMKLLISPGQVRTCVVHSSNTHMYDVCV